MSDTTTVVGDLTAEQNAGTLNNVSDEQLAGVHAWLSSRLPIILPALDAAQCGWQQTLLICTYLLAAVLNRHPEYWETFGSLLDRERVYYANLEAAWAAENQQLFTETVHQDAALFLLPGTQVPPVTQ